MKHFLLSFLFLGILGTAASAQQVDTMRVMVYNLLNFPNGRNDCGTNTVVPARWDTLRTIIDYVQPDILMVCELQNEIGADAILNNALNVNGRSGYERANFVLNTSSGITDLNNMIFYNSAKLGLRQQSEIQTDLRDVGVYQLYGKDASLATHQDTTFLDVMVTHLKASSGITNEDRRAEECDSIRAYIDTATAARNLILGGDFNFYSSNEQGFQTLLGGMHPLFDPINVTGNWNNNFAYAPYHTQSTRSSTRMDCGALGGMDSRFDFLMISNPIRTGSNRIAYLANTYTVLGNDGTTYNDPINDANNTSTVPNSVLNALHSMSDHLPVIMDIEVTYPNTTVLFNQLESFTGKATWDGNKIKWTMRHPGQIDRLELEVSEDAIVFAHLAELDAFSTKYTHNSNFPSDFYYRLKWVVGNQAFYSNIIFVADKGQAPTIKIYPNPAQYSFYVNILDDLSYSDTEIALYNAVGKRCYQTKHNFSTTPKVQLHLNSLKHGIYTLRMKNKYFSTNQRIVIQ